MACTMLPQEELKAYESQLMDSSDVLTSRQIAMAHALPLKSAVNVLSELLSSNPDLQRLYLTTKREDGGRMKFSLTESKETGENVLSSVLHSLCGSKGTKALDVMSLTTTSVRASNCNNIKADVKRVERKRKGGSVQGAQQGAAAGERSDGHMSLKSNPFGQKRVKVSAANFFGGGEAGAKKEEKKKSVFDSNPKAPKPKKSVFATTKTKAKKGKKEKVVEQEKEVKLGKDEMSKRKVLDSDSEDEDEEDDGTGFMEVGEKLPPPPAKAKDEDDGEEEFVGDDESDNEEKQEEKAKEDEGEADASTQSPENKTKKKRTKKDEKFNEFGEEIVKEKVVGAMDKAFGGGGTADVGVTDGAAAGGKRRVVKKRFVEKTEMDANGYIHTTTVEEEYSDYEEGTPPKKKKEETIVQRSSGVGGGAKKEKKQKGLMGFFGKKK